MYRYAFDFAVFDAEHFETGFLTCNPQNGIDNEKAFELVGSSMYLLRNIAKQIRDAEADLNAYVNQLSFGMMFQYCFDKGVELMFHYVVEEVVLKELYLVIIHLMSMNSLLIYIIKCVKRMDIFVYQP